MVPIMPMVKAATPFLFFPMCLVLLRILTQIFEPLYVWGILFGFLGVFALKTFLAHRARNAPDKGIVGAALDLVAAEDRKKEEKLRASANKKARKLAKKRSKREADRAKQRKARAARGEVDPDNAADSGSDEDYLEQFSANTKSKGKSRGLWNGANSNVPHTDLSKAGLTAPDDADGDMVWQDGVLVRREDAEADAGQGAGAIGDGVHRGTGGRRRSRGKRSARPNSGSIASIGGEIFTGR